MKTTAMVLALSLIPTAYAADACCAAETPVGEKAAACCAAEAKPDDKPDACCAPEPEAVANPHANHLELPVAAYSSESLYQLEVSFTDDSGQAFTLGSLQGRPVVLTMFFASCGYACPLLVADVTRIRDGLPVAIRDRVQLVLVSFDVARDTPAALKKYRAERMLDQQWTLLHGDNDAVRELAALLGVKYKQEADGQFAHSNLITVLTAEGEVAHQRVGLRGGLEETSRVLTSLARK